ncbi:MAG: hypothetical protein Q9187_004418 [Circinaria calcarea]
MRDRQGPQLSDEIVLHVFTVAIVTAFAVNAVAAVVAGGERDEGYGEEKGHCEDDGKVHIAGYHMSKDKYTIKVSDTKDSASDSTMRNAFLDHLIRNLDMSIYCELSILYYMDCSFLLLTLRALPQFLYLTPKSLLLPPPPTNQKQLLVILLTNAVCLLYHLFSARPEAGEVVRGYLHGGVLIDFVGVKGPVGKLALASLDLLVTGLQVGCAAAVAEKHNTRATGGGGGGGAGRNHTISRGTGQDIEAEEEGLRRSQEFTAPENTRAIELQPLRRSATGATDETDMEDETTTLAEHPLDTFAAGQHIIANLHVLDMIRTSWWSR